MLKWKRLLTLAICFGAFGEAFAADVPAGTACNAFAFSLQKELVRIHAGENVFFSPYSLSSALAMTWSGARAATAEQMGKVLHFDDARENILAGYAALNSQLEKTKGVQLKVANALWAQKGFPFLESFKSEIGDGFGGTFNPLDFAGQPEACRERINNWVKSKTSGKICDLLTPGALNAQTRLVLTNAIYFKGKWEKKFEKKATKKAVFHRADGGTPEVPMMHVSGEYALAKDEQCRFLLLPYKGGETGMAVLLPENSLDELCAGLTSEAFDKLFEQAQVEEVSVALPRFKLNSGYELGGTLAALGMADAFSAADADFSGIDGRRDLFISQVAHRAVLEVDEKGSEAAGATGVIMVMRCMPHVTSFVADRPFLAAIVHLPTRTVLFLGAVRDPS